MIKQLRIEIEYGILCLYILSLSKDWPRMQYSTQVCVFSIFFEKSRSPTAVYQWKGDDDECIDHLWSERRVETVRFWGPEKALFLFCSAKIWMFN